MNYIDLINSFWAVSEKEDLTANDQSTYFALLKYCNSLNWLNPFVCHWEILIQYSKTSKNSFYKSLEKLHRTGLIKFEKGQRNSAKKPKVFVLNIENKKGTIKEQSREQKGNLYKLLNPKTIKHIEANYTKVNENLEKWLGINSNNQIPELSDFISYAIEQKPTVDPLAVKLKYESWVANGWKNGNDKKIKNWKSSLNNTLPYIKENEQPKPTQKFAHLFRS